MTEYGPKIVNNGLIVALDAANVKSYGGTGSTWQDMSTTGTICSLIGVPTFSNGAFMCTAGKYVSLGDNDIYTNPSGFTIDVWFKPYSTTSSLAEKYQPAGYEYVFGYLDISGQAWLYAWVYDHLNSTYVGRIVVNAGVYSALNTFSNMCFVYDGGTTAASVKIYINGIQRDNSDFASGTFVSVRNGPTPLTFSNTNGGLGAGMNGELSCVKMYNRGLSGVEILQNFNALKTRFNLA